MCKTKLNFEYLMTDYSAMLPQEIPALPNAIPLTRFNLIALTLWKAGASPI